MIEGCSLFTLSINDNDPDIQRLSKLQRPVHDMPQQQLAVSVALFGLSNSQTSQPHGRDRIGWQPVTVTPLQVAQR